MNHFVSRREAQQALQWWDHQQAIHTRQQAEQIREDLLQELFTMRRSLELAPTGAILELPEGWLDKFEQLHHSLEQIGYALSPPYVEENLALAIQYLLEQLQLEQPGLTVQMQLDNQPDRSEHNRSEHNRVILMALDQLLRIALPQIAVQPQAQSQAQLQAQLQAQPQVQLDQLIQICLNYQANQAELQVSFPDLKAETLKAIRDSPALKYLERAFQLLTSGWCASRQTKRMLTCAFGWELESSARSQSQFTAQPQSQLQPDQKLVISAKEKQ